MNDFKLDEQLKKDCIVLGKMKTSQLLLLNNALVPWFILVPEVNVFEFFELEIKMQQTLLEEINALSRCLKNEFKTDKINIASIGNIVRQLHIHVVGRNKNDYCWPGVVWGAEGKRIYARKEITEIIKKLAATISFFNPHPF